MVFIYTSVCSKASNWRIKLREVAELSISTTAIGRSVGNPSCINDTKKMTQIEQISAMQRLFKPYKQKKAKLLKVVNEDCAARGISKVYFEKLGTKNEVAESERTATLELLAPTIAGIKLKPSKQAKAIKKQIKKTFGKSKKKKSKSPSAKKRSTAAAKKKAKKLIK